MKDFKFFSKNEKILQHYMWVTREGRSIFIQNLTTEHISNIINCLRGTGETTIPNPWAGYTIEEWDNILMFLNLQTT